MEHHVAAAIHCAERAVDLPVCISCIDAAAMKSSVGRRCISGAVAARCKLLNAQSNAPCDLMAWQAQQCMRLGGGKGKFECVLRAAMGGLDDRPFTQLCNARRHSVAAQTQRLFRRRHCLLV